MSKDEKIKYLEGVIYRLTYKNKPDELYEMINSELNNENGSEISSPYYVKDLKDTLKDFKTDSFKESKNNLERDIKEEIYRLKFMR